MAADRPRAGGASDGGASVTVADPRPAAPVEPPVGDRVLTVPNALSLLRLVGVPVFLWLMLGPHDDGAALGVLIGSGLTDYLDGKIARRWGLVSRVGQLLDPLADRLYIVATLAAFSARGIIPVALAALLVGRDVALSGVLAVLRRYGYGPLPVHFLGKSATFCLLYAFPLLLLADGHGTTADVVGPAAWAFTIWGTSLYWWAGVLYVAQAWRLVRAAAAETRPPAPE